MQGFLKWENTNKDIGNFLDANQRTITKSQSRTMKYMGTFPEILLHIFCTIQTVCRISTQ